MMRSFLALMAACALAQPAAAQLPQTRLYTLMPPGVAPGQISEVRIHTGADLDQVDRLIVNHPGIFATVKQQQDGNGGVRAVANTFRVAVEADVPPGRYEVRAVGLFGTSNPRMLIVDPRPAITETEPNNTASQAQAIAVGTLVDGVINGAGDLDVVKFTAKQGERIVVDCLAERIDSKLNPMLTLMDADARPIAFARNEYGRDAFAVFDVPADGEYCVEVRDATFSGGGEHLYRLQIHRGPHIRFVMPAAGEPGTTAPFVLYGYNLPGSTLVEDPKLPTALERLDVQIAVPAEPQTVTGVPSIAAGLDLFTYRHQSEAGVSNQVLLGLSSAPVILEQEPNDQPQTAQKLTAPFELAGQLTAPMDVDRITFEASKDQRLWIEVIGQRGGAYIDPFLTLERVSASADGVEQVKAITAQDDTGTNLAANVFDTATDDPAYLLTVSETGTYRLTLRNRASGSDPDPSRVYRLIVREPRPDFRLVAIPSGQTSGQTWPVAPQRGDHFALEVLAFRRDGFAGPIEVRPLQLPPGVTTLGTTIAAGDNSARLVLTASPTAATDPARVHLVGAARVAGAAGERTTEHPVRSGGIVWSRNGNTPAISQLESQFVAAVSAEPAPYQLSFDFPPTSVHQGRQLLIPMTLVRRGFNDKLTLKFDDGAKKSKTDVTELVFEAGQTAQTCRLFVRPDAPPGTWAIGGNCEAQVPYSRNPLQAEAAAVAKSIAEREAALAKAAEAETKQRVDAQTVVVNQASESLKQAEAAQMSAQQTLAQAQQALATAQQQQAEAVKQVAALTEQVKAAAAQQQAAAKAASDAPEDNELKAQAEKAQQSVTEQQAALESMKQSQTKAQEQLTQAEAAIKPAMDALAATQQATAQAQQAKVSGEALLAQLKSVADSGAKRAQTAEAARAAAEKAATDAANAAQPKNVAVVQPIPPVILTIRPAPVALEVKADKAELKAGETVNVTVTIKRQNGFAGPLKLSLALPEGATGISAPEVDVAADAGTGVLAVTATDQAAEGDVPHPVVRAKMDAGGEAVVDAPLALKIIK
jgi:hypothetical protein